jgi:hypothetical protein
VNNGIGEICKPCVVIGGKMVFYCCEACKQTDWVKNHSKECLRLLSCSRPGCNKKNVGDDGISCTPCLEGMKRCVPYCSVKCRDLDNKRHTTKIDPKSYDVVCYASLPCTNCGTKVGWDDKKKAVKCIDCFKAPGKQHQLVVYCSTECRRFNWLNKSNYPTQNPNPPHIQECIGEKQKILKKAIREQQQQQKLLQQQQQLQPGPPR